MKRIIASIICTAVVLSSASFSVFADEENTSSDIQIEETTNLATDLKAGFINRLYRNFLGRDADIDGLRSWMDLLNNGFTGADLVVGFSVSPEFRNKNLSNSEYVESLYRTVLGREADEVGKSAWVDMLSFGQTREAILSGFISSPEFTDMCCDYGIVAGTYDVPYGSNIMLENLSIASFVANLYDNCLGREFDEDGISEWVSLLKNGKVGGGDVAKGFLHSEEFINLHTSNIEYVKILYRTLMSRDADDIGLDYWVGRLKNGDSRDFVLDNFIDSSEFGDICASSEISVRWNPRELYPQATEVLDQVGWDLRSALNWAAMPYLKFDTDPDLGIRYYADYGFTNHTGNCYVMASCFTEMALALGFDPVQVSGIVPLRRGGMGPHSWVYIDELIYDPDYQKESGEDGFGITYGTPGTWMYTDPVPMS